MSLTTLCSAAEKGQSLAVMKLIQVYVSLIKPISEYGCQLWHGGLNDNQQASLETIQERAVSIAYPSLSYNSSLWQANLPALHHRRDEVRRRMFHYALDPNHNLHPLLSPERTFA